MSDFLQARTFDGALWVSASDAMALRSQLVEAERGLDAARVDNEQFEQANEFLNERINELHGRLAEYEEKDGQRTREHNILVRENRDQAARLAEAEALLRWISKSATPPPSWEIIDRIDAFLAETDCFCEGKGKVDELQDDGTFKEIPCPDCAKHD